MEVLRPTKVFTTLEQIENAWKVGEKFKVEFSESGRLVTVEDEVRLRKESKTGSLAVRYGVYLDKFGYI